MTGWILASCANVNPVASSVDEKKYDFELR
jgi:hypothetical protein